eukprot:TRINITY_DN11964_c0_g1_i1.p1 TRINITY_DN11964_c0_g1~~TRINITY_DN11964_c0_g1_i1.p1  ORF type:complete len:230 (-),score=35.47 TRINITY_DN11964_c0_g1_i1:55-744(-)
MRMRDLHGNERGHCITCASTSEPCPSYCTENNFITCAYCGHKPIEHARVVQDGDNFSPEIALRQAMAPAGAAEDYDPSADDESDSETDLDSPPKSRAKRTLHMPKQRHAKRRKEPIPYTKWNPQEDERLRGLLANRPDDGSIPWRVIAEKMGTRSTQQCISRWKLLKENDSTPGRRGFHWAPEEDVLLRKSIQEQGTDRIRWEPVAAAFGGTRTVTQCFNRWQRIGRES